MSEILTLKNRTAVITGGSKGIGFAIAKKMAEAGMRTAIIARGIETAEEAAKSIRDNGGICQAYRCDVSKPEEIESCLKEICNGVGDGSLDVIVNNAAILDTSTVETLTEEIWDDVIDVNLKGTFFMMQKALPYLEKSSNPRIINISSNSGRMGGFENGLSYTASKGGVIALTYGAARRLASKGITVNCVAPGTVRSEMSDKFSKDSMDNLLKQFPLGRLGDPEEIAAAVCYFASEEARWTTGAVLDVNGGMFIG